MTLYKAPLKISLISSFVLLMYHGSIDIQTLSNTRSNLVVSHLITVRALGTEHQRLNGDLCVQPGTDLMKTFGVP